jgi:hypothetical protein
MLSRYKGCNAVDFGEENVAAFYRGLTGEEQNSNVSHSVNPDCILTSP